mgnify:CR=1 FL=1
MTGKHLGVTVMRELGSKAAAKMIAAANMIVAKPEKDGRRLVVSDEILLGLAVTGDPEAVRYVLDLVGMDLKDPSLGKRAVSALYRAYVEPSALHALADAKALTPNIKAIIDIAKDGNQPPQVTNDAVNLIRMIGMPHCLPALTEMVSFPAREIRYRYVGANNALKCAGAEGIVGVVTALPTDLGYDKEELVGAVASEIVKLGNRPEVLAAVRTLAAEKSWVARWVAVEAIAGLKASAEVGVVRGLTGDKTVLRGYHGAAGGKKAEPTLGARAKEVAASLGG